ncbi:MAG: F0F1 ATP synthase subunit delta [Arenicella sp.]
MADNASIARPYAKAVFDLATESSNQDDWSLVLESLANIAQDEEFGKAVNSPQVKPEQLEELILGVLGKKLPEGGDNFVKLLTQNGRLESLPDVQQQYALLLAESRKSIEAEVLTARPLSADQKSSLTDALQSRLGVSVALVETVDESLIGGAIVKAGDLVIDGSARGRVEKLAIALS